MSEPTNVNQERPTISKATVAKEAAAIRAKRTKVPPRERKNFYREQALEKLTQKQAAEDQEQIIKTQQQLIRKDRMIPELFNKQGFQEELDTQLANAKRQEIPLSLLYLDLDDLKPTNDDYGHPVGDKLLQETASIILAAVRSSDIAARIGGDEFAVILPGTSPANSLVIAEKIRQAMEKTLLQRMSDDMPGRKDPLTISIGSSGFQANHIMHSEELIKQADAALYNSKKDQDGHKLKNRVTLYEPGMVKRENNNQK